MNDDERKLMGIINNDLKFIFLNNFSFTLLGGVIIMFTKPSNPIIK